jgi:hypothetical protein
MTSVSFCQIDDTSVQRVCSGANLGAGFGFGGGFLNAEYGTPAFGGIVSGYLLASAGYIGTIESLEATSLHNVGLLYGFARGNDDIYWSVSTGVSYLWFNNWEWTIDPVKKQTFGVPLEGHFLMRVSQTVALGFSLYGNINPYHHTGGISFTFRID